MQHNIIAKEKYVLDQILGLVERIESLHCVKKYQGNYRVRGYSCRN
ncbi:MAG: DUF4372 domain-containing protein [Saprospiraceae bacterium]|nr:DUF4372 domain-containing protein [Saprospiraceae bacterium]